MRSALPEIAAAIGIPERTLRRAASRGAVRCRRPGSRTLELPAGEIDYLRENWDLLRTLTAALRTEPNVGLAILYGSAARGDQRSDSDLDLLVSFRADLPGAPAALAGRLERASGRPVDIARLSRVRTHAPLLLVSAIDDGRVLVDRDGAWDDLRRGRTQLARAAARHLANGRVNATRSLRELLSEEF
jgi:predicted nucleotidyltransferase